MSPYPPLIRAILSNNPSTLRTLLSTNHDPNQTAGKYSWSPLHFAAYHHHTPTILSLLLSHNADISAREVKDGFTPLHKAAERGYVDIITTLLDAGADIESPSNAGSTPLLIAVKFGYTQAVEVLLSRRADVNCVDRTGRGVLHIAAEKGNLELLRLLYEKGVGVAGAVDEGNAKGRTPLYLAVRNGWVDVVRYLVTLDGVDVNKAGDDGWTALHAVSFYGGKNGGEVAMVLLENGADVGARISSTGYTPLHKASEAGNLEVARRLVDKGADLDAKSERRHTPLYAAVRFGNSKRRGGMLEMVKMLMEKGADAGIKDQFGMGVGSIAKQKGFAEIMKALDVKDEFGL
ncbi:Ankyrin-2 [Arthrobotrys entomopaga]|nr:Ankyrin-2 [Arthrobotrys entomopaga]